MAKAEFQAFRAGYVILDGELDFTEIYHSTSSEFIFNEAGDPRILSGVTTNATAVSFDENEIYQYIADHYAEGVIGKAVLSDGEYIFYSDATVHCPDGAVYNFCDDLLMEEDTELAD